MIIADSNIWIDFFKRPRSSTGLALEHLIRNDRAALTGMVLAEVLRGSRSEVERELVDDVLESIPYVATSRTAWARAGEIAMDLDIRGMPTPMSDLVIAAVAIEGDHEVFTRDKHFGRVPGLRLFKPDTEARNA